VGLKNSGKTSFLLTINRKYSEFDRKKPQGLSSTQFADLMGITVVKWDVGEWERSKPRFLTDANIYLYDTNLIYYFIDATSPNSLDENIQWFSRIVQYLREFSINIPIILIISQVDLDVAEKPEIREVITLIRSKISAIALKYMKNFNFFETSIFDLTSVLRAFSYGITVLNPNKEISDKILQKYSKILNSSAIMIFNENGLILGEHSIDPNFDMKHDYPLKFVLETIVPECIDIIKNQKRHEFSQKSLNSRLITKLNDGKAIFMEKFEISDFKMFLIIYTDIKELNEEFNKNLKNLVLEFTEIYKMFIF
jgi:GTPase SAR1 family protein